MNKKNYYNVSWLTRLCCVWLLLTFIPGRGVFSMPTNETRELLQELSITGVNEVTGTVKDDRGEPLPGVNVMIKGTQTGTSTDATGRFSIRVTQENAVLIFSFVGYQTQEITPGSQRVLDVTLLPDQKSLEEVVVIGYGTQKKTSLTAAVSTMKGDEVASLPVANLSNTLGGRVSGVVVKQGSGEPGADGSNIYIRGLSTTGSSSPLLIVDGIPRSFQQLNPNDIESFTVLKDAAAVAPYGVAGANGVILVTTKKGQTGRPTISYNGYIGFQNPTIFPKYVNGYEYALLKNEAAINNGLPPAYTDEELQKFKDGSEPDLYPPNDPFKQIVQRNTPVTSHSIDVSGGTDRIQYFVGFGYLNQKGMWPTTYVNRYNLSTSLAIKATESTKISLNLNGRVEQGNYPAVGTGRVFELIGFAHPGLGPLEFSNGMYGNYAMGAIFKSGYRKYNNNILYSQLTIDQDVKAVTGLKLTGTIAYDPSFNFQKNWRIPTKIASIVDRNQKPFEFKEEIFEQTQPSLTHNVAKSSQLTQQIGFTYTRDFGKNSLSVLGMFEARASNWMGLDLSRRNYNLYIDEINMGSSNNADMSTSGSSSQTRQVGMVYRVSYDYDRKYLVEVSGRYDGHYYFAPNKRFGFFPAFSLGWRVSEESFIKDHFDWIQNLKIRASYGEVGALAGGPFQYLSAYNVMGGAYKFGNNVVSGVQERSEPNLNITWERAKKTDVGIEFSLFNGALNIEADYFYEKRSNMLVAPNVITPVEYGIGLSQVNAGVMENKGVEISGNFRHKFNSGLTATLGGSFTYAKNKVLEIFETPSTYDNPNRRLTGKSLGTQFGYRALGFFQPEDFESGVLKSNIARQPWGNVQPGDIRYEDINGDGTINEHDIVEIGYPSAVPLIIYGISPSLSYKNFSLDLLFQGTGKSNFYLMNEAAWPFFNGMSAFRNHFDYWTPDNRDAKNPRLTTSPTANNTQTSSFWMNDISYLRLKNITLSFDLPETIAQRVRMQKIRVYGSGQNVLTWTKLLNFDPEMSNSLGRNYPQQRVISIGLNLVF